MPEAIQAIYQKYATFIRYALVGAMTTFVDLFSLYVLTELSGINPQTDTVIFSGIVAIAFLLAAVFSYVFNRIWTFESKDKDITGQFFRFLIVSVIGFLMTQLLMWCFVSVLGIYYLLAKAITSMTVLIWNFGLNKLWTFKVPQHHPPGQYGSIG